MPRIDLLACCLAKDTASFSKFRQVVWDTAGVDLAASTDLTGNSRYDANWILETHGIDVRGLYFVPDLLIDFEGAFTGQRSPTEAELANAKAATALTDDQAHAVADAAAADVKDAALALIAAAAKVAADKDAADKVEEDLEKKIETGWQEILDYNFDIAKQFSPNSLVQNTREKLEQIHRESGMYRARVQGRLSDNLTYMDFLFRQIDVIDSRLNGKKKYLGRLLAEGFTADVFDSQQYFFWNLTHLLEDVVIIRRNLLSLRRINDDDALSNYIPWLGHDIPPIDILPPGLNMNIGF